MEAHMNHLKTALLLAGLISLQAHAAITVRDDDGNTVTVAKPAQRILALAPHVTELLFAAGGGEKIAGVVSYSDYPEAAKKIPQVGDNRQYDMERIIAMKPDLIVVWMHGSAERQIAMLRQLKVPIYHSEPRKLADIPDSSASAIFGPTPETFNSARNSARSSAVAKPYRICASSRTTR